MTQPEKGLDADAIEKEVAVPLPEREAMSLIDPAGKLVPLSEAPIGTDGAATTAQKQPPVPDDPTVA